MGEGNEIYKEVGLPEPISRQDNYLSYIAIQNPSVEDIENLIPQSRQEEYLKYIALNGGAGGGSGADVNVVQTTGTSTSNVMSQNAVSRELNKKVDAETTINGKPLTDNIELTAEDLGIPDIDIVQTTGQSTESIMSQKAVTDELNKKLSNNVTINGKQITEDTELTAEDIGTYTKEEIESKIQEAESNINIVQETGQSTEDVMSQKAVTDAIKASGGTGVVIAQTTGDSETSVMSQKAVTEELNKLDTKIDSKVNKDTTINGHSLDENIELSPEDIGTYSKDEIDNKIDETTEKLDKLGTAAYCDTGISAGNVPTLDFNGKLSNSVIPALAITDTYVANSEGEMLNLEGVEQGDICIRTDENKTYILDAEPKKFRYLSETVTDGDNWVELLSPTSDVTSVNGQKGNVTLTTEDLGTYTKEEIESKIEEKINSNITIVQETGYSQSDIMSQYATTMALAYKLQNNEPDTNRLSVGFLSTAKGDRATSFGDGATSDGDSALSLGTHAEAKGDTSISIGADSTSTASGAITIGKNAKSTATNAIAIGQLSVADEQNTVSFGSGESVTSIVPSRRLVNVTDPVNEQDAATKKYVDNAISSIPSQEINIVQSTGTSTTDVMSQNIVTTELNKRIENKATGSSSIAIGDSKATGSLSVSIGRATTEDNGSVAIGTASAKQSSSIIIGNNVSSNANSSVVIGDNITIGAFGGSVTIGSLANVDTSNSVALGSHSQTNGESKVVSVGSGNEGDTYYNFRRIINVDEPINNRDAATKHYVDTAINSLVSDVKTWTPVLSTFDDSTMNVSYEYRNATYLTVGNLVYITFHLKANIISPSSTGDSWSKIKGLPYMSISEGGHFALSIVECAGSVGGAVSAKVMSGTNVIRLYDATGSNSCKWGSGDVWVGFSGWYIKEI